MQKDLEAEIIKPNYELYYKIELKDDWIKDGYRFYASDDGKAREMALSFVEECNRQALGKSGYDWFQYKPLRLERIAYVMKEVEEKTRIPLDGDIASRIRNGGIINLLELADL